MSKERLSPLKKAAVIAGLGAGSLVVGGAIEKANAPESHTITVEAMQVLGTLGLGVGGVEALRVWARNKSIELAAAEAKRIEVLQQQLPKLAVGVDPQDIFERLEQTDDSKSYNTYYVMTYLCMTRNAGIDGKPANSEAAYESLAYDIQGVISCFARTLKPGEEDDRTRSELMDVCWFLDDALPIADDCPRTAQTEDNGKYWYDFILSRAIGRAHLSEAS